MSLLVKYHKPLALGIVGALIYSTIVNHNLFTSASLKLTNEDQGTELAIALQPPHLLNEKKTTVKRKPLSLSQLKDNNQLDSQYHNQSNVGVASRTNRYPSIKRGWSYKGRGRWRCKVRTIGCFNAAAGNITKSFTLLVDSSPDMTDSHCILECSKRNKGKFVFAGLRNGNECRCAAKPDYLIDPNQASRKKCNVRCTGDKSRTCGGRRGLTMLYIITAKCKEDVPLDQVTDGRALLGCYRKPPNIRLLMEEYTIPTNRSAARCIIQCEGVGLVLAIPVQPNLCYCGLTAPRFKLSNPVNVTHCSQAERNYIMVYRTNSEDKRCGQKRFLKVGELHRKVGLITFPGSGNTWTRHLIESATGIYTGSVYSDHNLVNGGYLGELLPPENYKVAVVKSHHQNAISEMKYLDALINVYRNPYDALLSEYNRRKMGHTGWVNTKEFDAAGFSEVASRTLLHKWFMITKVVLDSNLPSFVFSYDELLQHPLLLAEQMSRFIMGNTLDEKELQDRLACLYLASKGEFKREKKYREFDPYTREVKISINREIEELDKQLKKFGKRTVLRFLRPIDHD